VLIIYERGCLHVSGYVAHQRLDGHFFDGRALGDASFDADRDELVSEAKYRRIWRRTRHMPEQGGRQPS
jgi:hypothetical protein